MKHMIVAAAFCAAPALADPLDLIDYEAIFAQNANEVEVVSNTRSILQVGDVTLLHDTAEPQPYTGLDESGQAAVGCFVTILATIESAMQACEVDLPEDQAAIQASYTVEALSFYAANAVPAVDIETVRARFDNFVATQIEGARPYCANLDVVTNLADRLFTEDSRAEVSGMISVPRLPVSNPCL